MIKKREPFFEYVEEHLLVDKQMLDFNTQAVNDFVLKLLSQVMERHNVHKVFYEMEDQPKTFQMKYIAYGYRITYI